ncbi:MAG: M23 family metallopeptidase [Candidatus Saganbacteria bacterium]|nr:M23 family metallopeptidase [Candidatus Saganbacteria bacterium]
MIISKKLIRITAIVFLLFLVGPSFAGSRPILPKTVFQGKTFTVPVISKDPVSGEAVFLGKTIPFYGYKNGARAIIGVPPLAATGQNEIIINLSAGGKKVMEKKQVIIMPAKFKAESLVFMPTKIRGISKAKIKIDQDELAVMISKETPVKFWEGRFIMPVKGYITSPFGAYRNYNGKRLGDHRGMDIGGNPVGTPIKAANSGVVASAKLLPTLGSCIVIDHGQGVCSIYMHMSKLLVTEGDEVRKGDIIGHVGNIGLSSGPHLHFGISVHNTRVDPVQWVQKEI